MKIFMKSNKSIF